MSYSFTTTDTFTKTHAVYLGSKVAADLQQMQLFYGKPSDGDIDEFIEELVILMLYRCLKMVEYGFMRGDNWVVVTRYTARFDGYSLTDERSGRVPAGVNTNGASWHSYLELNDRWWREISDEERRKIKELLPFERTAGTEPGIGLGSWTLDKTYSRNGVSLERGVFGSQ